VHVGYVWFVGPLFADIRLALFGALSKGALERRNPPGSEETPRGFQRG
jgi:hypothetical protein